MQTVLREKKTEKFGGKRLKFLFHKIKTFLYKRCSKNYNIPPKIDPNYLSDPIDKKVAVQSIKLARKIINQPAMKKYRPTEYAPGEKFQSDIDLEKVAGNIGTTIFHPVGTCAMGVQKNSVTNPKLKVNGIENLRVVDASVMPSITSGNTNSPTLMIA